MGNMCLKLLTIQSGFALFVAGFATAVCAGIIKDGFQLVRFIEGCVILFIYHSFALYLVFMLLLNRLKICFLVLFLDS